MTVSCYSLWDGASAVGPCGSAPPNGDAVGAILTGFLAAVGSRAGIGCSLPLAKLLSHVLA